jgi:hypothetical protein
MGDASSSRSRSTSAQPDRARSAHGKWPSVVKENKDVIEVMSSDDEVDDLKSGIKTTQVGHNKPAPVYRDSDLTPLDEEDNLARTLSQMDGNREQVSCWS